ncbi:sensor histidine kinase [Idiomarina xiamenensis]|uniref:histidine kinase n=1 Tax=Idiomarina xiamenensis 10-D-4 TaxID=740709 RepID=K2J9K4_9GAMM|nr:HAMP domain-containing sensor histidine kinase [Idiomarina xiamenensis]EKE79936.1 signal transduction histidine kinase [Idiomarina xiamenensis 10-D-4]
MTKVSSLLRRLNNGLLSGLQLSLLVYVVLPMLVLSGLAISSGLQVANEQATEKLKSDLELVGRAIRLPISDALMRGDLATVSTNLESVFSIGRVYGASVYDTNGDLVAAAGIAEPDLTNSLLFEEVVRTGQQQDSYRSVAGRDVYSHFLPIIDRGGRINGLLQITRRASDFDQQFRQLSNIAWLSWGVFALLTIALLVFGHYRGVGRHVDRLVETMRKVAQGQRSVRAAEQGPRELREVARGLNGMLDSMLQAEQALQQSQAHERRLNQALREKEKMAAIGRVASGVAHELGAPLTVIDGRAQRLQRQHPDSESQRQLTAVRGQVQRLTRMVQQLLAFSRTPTQQWQRLSVKQLLLAAQQQIGYEYDSGAAIHINMSQDYYINGDQQRLELALVNILRNALQVAEQRIELSCSQQQQQLCICCCDDGPGLPENLSVDDMLSPFVSTKAQGKGTGLGLTIVQHIISDHGGELQLSNHAAGGCCVSVCLPSAEQGAEQ